MTTRTLWKAAEATDPGPERAANEDRVLVDADRGIFLVADGLGGHAAGERAAQIAVDAIAREVNPAAGGVKEQVRFAITAANNEIYREACGNEAYSGMACVLTLAVVHDDMVTLGHVGDSRLYLIWNGAVRKLTSDHSPVGELEDQGQLSEQQAMSHPRRNEVFRDVGSCERTIDDPFIEVRSFPLQAGAALLLCSDGLSDALTSTRIGEIVDTYDGDPDRVAAELVAAANEAGGRDNVSVVFIAGPEFSGSSSPAALAARVRHSITRHRRVSFARRLFASRLLWMGLGIILGMVLWAFGQRFYP